MSTYKGILSFPAVFTAKVPTTGGDPKFSATLLFPPGDPQIAQIQAEVDAGSLNTFPSGLPAGSNLCFAPYDVKYAGKEYYDPRFTGWYALGASAKADDRPVVVDMAHQPIVDPSQVYSGSVVWMNLGISGYTKGTGGVGGWLNGLMVTEEEPTMGRLDGKPSVGQMFANVGAVAPVAPAPVAPAPAAPAPVAPPVAPAPVAPVAPAPPAAPVHQMTAAAGGATYEAMIGANWTDETLIAHGMMLPPGGVTPSFA